MADLMRGENQSVRGDAGRVGGWPHVGIEDHGVLGVVIGCTHRLGHGHPTEPLDRVRVARLVRAVEYLLDRGHEVRRDDSPNSGRRDAGELWHSSDDLVCEADSGREALDHRLGVDPLRRDVELVGEGRRRQDRLLRHR
jgi:hypothetical protein